MIYLSIFTLIFALLSPTGDLGSPHLSLSIGPTADKFPKSSDWGIYRSLSIVCMYLAPSPPMAGVPLVSSEVGQDSNLKR